MAHPAAAIVLLLVTITVIDANGRQPRVADFIDYDCITNPCGNELSE